MIQVEIKELELTKKEREIIIDTLIEYYMCRKETIISLDSIDKSIYRLRCNGNHIQTLKQETFIRDSLRHLRYKLDCLISHFQERLE